VRLILTKVQTIPKKFKNITFFFWGVTQIFCNTNTFFTIEIVVELLINVKLLLKLEQ